ncbi:hypothetical protein Tco_0144340 [Tanacetum coccineum]
MSVKHASTPIETYKPLTKDEEAADVDVHLYKSMIGSLMYLTASRPDIMFAVCACSRFQVTPKTSHLHAVKRIFRYLKGKPTLGLWYPKESSFDLVAYSDSDYGGANLDRKSTTGGCQFLGHRLISWQCKKQTIVATSTTEAEYVAVAHCCGQVLWIQNQMLDYGFNFMNTRIYIDNESTICIVKNLVFYSKTKHIEIRHHFIRDAYEKKLIQVLKIHTDNNVADLLTKAFDVSSYKGSKELLERVLDATYVLLLPNLLILCLTKVSTDSVKLVPMGKIVSVPLDHFPVHALTSKVFSFMIKKGKHFSGRVTPLFPTMLVPPTEDESEGSERPSEAQPTPSPSHTSEAQVRKSVKSSKGAPSVPINTKWDDLEMDIDDTTDYILAQYKGSLEKDGSSKGYARLQSTVKKIRVVTRELYGTDSQKLSTDKVEEGTAKPDDNEPKECTTTTTQTTTPTTSTPTPTTFGDDETIA